MREYVPQSGDLLPFNVRMCQPDGLGDHLDRFTDDLQIADDGIDSLVVIFKSFSRAGVPARAARVGWLGPVVYLLTLPIASRMSSR
jgi:hypothetical protein